MRMTYFNRYFILFDADFTAVIRSHDNLTVAAYRDFLGSDSASEADFYVAVTAKNAWSEIHGMRKHRYQGKNIERRFDNRTACGKVVCR